MFNYSVFELIVINKFKMYKDIKLIIFMPSIEGGELKKNLFIISNYLSLKFKKIIFITSSSSTKKLIKE